LPSKWLFAIGGSVGLLPALFFGLAPLRAQTSAPSAPIPAANAPPATKATTKRSVWDAVYSKAQAARGLKGYNTLCARCHGDNLLGGEEATALVGKEFLDNWNGKTVTSLIEETRLKMPSDGPGKLSRQQCTDMTAYLLSANGFPAGEGDLPSDPEATGQILITPKK
jgi:mono/diheme cytochrome c family protein